MAKEEKKVENKNRYEIVGIPKEYDWFIQDNEVKDEETGEPVKLDVQMALRKILNDLEELKQGLLGN